MPNKDEEARRLAAAHYEIEPGITHIFRLRGGAEVEERPEEPIKLLEVNQFTIPSGIMPLQFGPAPARGFHLPSVIVEVTPEEFEKIQSRELQLSDGWTVGDFFPNGFVDRPCR